MGLIFLAGALGGCAREIHLHIHMKSEWRVSEQSVEEAAKAANTLIDTILREDQPPNEVAVGKP